MVVLDTLRECGGFPQTRSWRWTSISCFLFGGTLLRLHNLNLILGRLVTADGKLRRLDKDNGPLFWVCKSPFQVPNLLTKIQGMRGAGDSFGIAVRFFLKTQSIPRDVVHFTYDVSETHGSPRKMASIFTVRKFGELNSLLSDRFKK